MINHLQTIKRPAFVINLDPAAEKFSYQPLIDIRQLITLEDVMEELHLGPNGGLVYCMEYLLENFDWLEEEVGSEWEDEYIIIDCPGKFLMYIYLENNSNRSFFNQAFI
jgi:GTPase SAR1 family protein